MMLRGVSFFLEADVQESERLNKTLTLFGERVPAGSLELCSARAAIKHYLGLNAYGESGTRKFRDVKPTARRLFQDSVSGWPLIPEVESNERRFCPAVARNDVPSLAEAHKSDREVDPETFPVMTAEKMWAVSANAKLRKLRTLDTCGNCLSGIPSLSFVMPGKDPTEAPLFFLITDKVRTALHLACFKREGQGQDGQGVYSIREPLTFVKSHAAFERFFHMIQTSDICVWEFLVEALPDSRLAILFISV